MYVILQHLIPVKRYFLYVSAKGHMLIIKVHIILVEFDSIPNETVSADRPSSSFTFIILSSPI